MKLLEPGVGARRGRFADPDIGDGGTAGTLELGERQRDELALGVLAENLVADDQVGAAVPIGVANLDGAGGVDAGHELGRARVVSQDGGAVGGGQNELGPLVRVEVGGDGIFNAGLDRGELRGLGELALAEVDQVLGGSAALVAQEIVQLIVVQVDPD